MFRKFWLWLDRTPTEETFIWRALAVGGGGAFSTPPLKRADAIRYVTLQGTHQLCWVDDVNRIIFYRYK